MKKDKKSKDLFEAVTRALVSLSRSHKMENTAYSTLQRAALSF